MPAQKKQPEGQLSGKPKIILEWKAPIRPFKPRSKEFFSTILALAFLIIVILIFLKEWFLIFTIISLIFLVIVSTKIPPETVTHRLTSRGIETGNKEYRWEQLGRFWFEESWGEKILCVENFGTPRVLMMLLGEIEEKKLKEIISSYLPQETPPKTWLDKASEWLSQKISLE